MEERLDLKWLNSVLQTDKDCVFGYIRRSQRLLPITKNAYFNIPSLVCYIILQYYYMAEYFTKHGECMRINDDGDTVTQLYGDIDSTAYGNMWISCDKDIIYEWKVEILRIPKVCRSYVIGIGLNA